MKRIALYTMGAVALAALSSCQDETATDPQDNNNGNIVAQVGDEVMFGSTVGDLETRTIYGDKNEATGNYPVTWESGDQITIYSPQVTNLDYCHYSVTPKADDAKKSSSVDKVGDTGLRWASDETHYFYGFYPSAELGANKQWSALLPAQQNATSWTKAGITSESGETTGTKYIGVGNTDFAFMYGFGSGTRKTNPIGMTFKPYMTILDIEIPIESDMTLSSLMLSTEDGTPITGKYAFQFEGSTENPVPAYIQSYGVEATSTIQVQFYNNGSFMDFKAGDTVVVRTYLLPSDTDYAPINLRVTIRPYYSTQTISINLAGASTTTEDTDESGVVTAHKVTKATLPALTFNTSGGIYNWISMINPNKYVNELSIPGSRMSYNLSGTKGIVVYQNTTIAEQYADGIRAFYLGVTNKSSDALVLYKQTNVTLATVVEEIAAQLTESETRLGENSNEFAFVQLSLRGSESSSEAMINAIVNTFKAMADNNNLKSRLITTPMTASTTIADVKGKIIFKINTNNDAQENLMPADANLPAMFARWQGIYPRGGFDIYWGSSNHSNSTTGMTWYYQEATTIRASDVTSGGNASFNQKMQYIEEMWNRSAELYLAGDDHSTWYMNDLGGSLIYNVITTETDADGNETTVTTVDANETDKGVIELADEVAPMATEYLQTRNENATLGIVYMNLADPDYVFSDGQKYSGTLIESIINNNFSYDMRPHSTTVEGGSGTSTTTNDSSYGAAGNAIE